MEPVAVRDRNMGMVVEKARAMATVVEMARAKATDAARVKAVMVVQTRATHRQPSLKNK